MDARHSSGHSSGHCERHAPQFLRVAICHDLRVWIWIWIGDLLSSFSIGESYVWYSSNDNQQMLACSRKNDVDRRR